MSLPTTTHGCGSHTMTRTFTSTPTSSRLRRLTDTTFFLKVQQIILSHMKILTVFVSQDLWRRLSMTFGWWYSSTTARQSWCSVTAGKITWTSPGSIGLLRSATLWCSARTGRASSWRWPTSIWRTETTTSWEASSSPTRRPARRGRWSSSTTSTGQTSMSRKVLSISWNSSTPSENLAVSRKIAVLLLVSQVLQNKHFECFLELFRFGLSMIVICEIWEVGSVTWNTIDGMSQNTMKHYGTLRCTCTQQKKLLISN